MTILHRKILIGNGRILMLDNMKRTFYTWKTKWERRMAMKYKITYLNQWGCERTKTISAETESQAKQNAEEYVISTEYDYMIEVGYESKIISITPLKGSSKWARKLLECYAWHR